MNFWSTTLFQKITQRIQNFPRTCNPCLTLIVLNTSSTPRRPFLWKANLIWTKDRPQNAILWALPLEIDLVPTRVDITLVPISEYSILLMAYYEEKVWNNFVCISRFRCTSNLLRAIAYPVVNHGLDMIYPLHVPSCKGWLESRMSTLDLWLKHKEGVTDALNIFKEQA